MHTLSIHHMYIFTSVCYWRLEKLSGFFFLLYRLLFISRSSCLIKTSDFHLFPLLSCAPVCLENHWHAVHHIRWLHKHNITCITRVGCLAQAWYAVCVPTSWLFHAALWWVGEIAGVWNLPSITFPKPICVTSFPTLLKTSYPSN